MKQPGWKILISLGLVAGLLVCSGFTAAADLEGDRVVVLDFLALDDRGNYIDTLGLKTSDLVNLSRVMSQGIAAKLVQYGKFEVLDSISLRDEIAALGFSYDTSAWERAQILLANDLADQVITGSLTLLQTTAVIGVQRFQVVAGKPALVGSAMSSAAKIADSPNLIDSLVANLFPSDVQVIERSVDQVFAIPSHLRLNLGQSQQITVYALDSLGRPVANPQFLFFSSDESKVRVNEQGIVTANQPGSSTITVRAISQTTRSGSPATMNVTVLPPTLGVRLGTLLIPRGATKKYPLRLGMRLTPTVDQKSTPKPNSSPAPVGTPAPAESTNPLTLVASFFGSVLTNGLMTIDLDLDPTRELLIAFGGVQRSSSGYIGTGVGYVSPLDDMNDQKGFLLRFTLGTQYQAEKRVSVPAEVVLDAVFPSSLSFSPSFRIGVNLGLDLFP